MLKLYFTLLKSAVARIVVCRGICGELAIEELRDIERRWQAMANLKLFAEQHHQTEMLEALFRRLRITQLSETDYDTDLTSIDELQKVTVDDLDAQFVGTIMPWENVNEISELMKFLILRWLDRFNAGGTGDRVVSDDWYGYARADGVRYQIWSLVVTVMRELADRYWVECYAIHLFAAWAKVIELLPMLKAAMLEAAYHHEILEKFETTVRAIPERVVSPTTALFALPCPTFNPDYDTNEIWDEKSEH